MQCVQRWRIDVQLWCYIALLGSRGLLRQVCEVPGKLLNCRPAFGAGILKHALKLGTSDHTHLISLPESLSLCLPLSSLSKKFLAPFQWFLHLITLVIISSISLHPGPVGIRLVVFRCKPVVCILLHLFKIPGSSTIWAKLGQLLPAVYSSLLPLQEEIPLYFTSGHVLINYILLVTTVTS